MSVPRAHVVLPDGNVAVVRELDRKDWAQVADTVPAAWASMAPRQQGEAGAPSGA